MPFHMPLFHAVQLLAVVAHQTVVYGFPRQLQPGKLI
jgi:hypothetical protein